MASPLVADVKGVETVDPEQIEGSVKRWIRNIIDCNCDVTLHDIDGETQEFLFDAELEGVRLVMIRPHQPPARPQLILSPREREIARMVAKGYPNKTIAAVLDISSWTVCTYLRRIFAKLNVCSRAAMVARLIEEGLLAEKTDAVPAFLSRRR